MEVIFFIVFNFVLNIFWVIYGNVYNLNCGDFLLYIDF